MTRMAASAVRKDFSDALNRVAYGNERILLHRRGKRLAALVSVEDLELLEALEDRVDLEEAKAALKDVKKHGTVSWEKLKQGLGL